MTEREAKEIFEKWMDCKDADQADPSCDGKCLSCEYYTSAEEEEEAIQMAISALEKQERDRWIPITEKLPEPYKEVIVTDIETIDTYTSEYHGGGYWNTDTGDAKNRIIAWMPLPEPYEAEEES